MAQSNCGCVPPDVQVAAGPTHIVEMVNVEGETYSKQTSAITTFALSSFFQSGTDFISDPKVLYDNSSSTWFASVLDVNNIFAITSSKVIVAVSTTTDPTGTWNIYSINDGANLPDQPIIGVSDDKFVASVNDFGPNTFFGAHYWVLNKNQMVTGAASIAMDSYGPFSNLVSVHPVRSLSHTSTLYMVSAGNNATAFDQVTGNYLPTTKAQVFAITGIPHTTQVTSTTLTLSGLLQVPTVSQTTELGSSVGINTDDARVEDAVWFQGKLWFAFNIGCTPKGDSLRACVRVTQVDTTANTITQDFNLSSTGINYYYPALSVDNLGNMMMIFGYSGATNSTCCYPSLGVTGQAAGDPLNTLATLKPLAKGTAPETTTRYGDYFGAGTDPSAPSLVWVAGEYHKLSTGNCLFRDGSSAGNCWSTFIAGVTMTGYTISANPSTSTFAFGQASLTSTITISSLGNFGGTVNLSTSFAPSNAAVSISPSSVAVSAGGQTTATLKANSTNLGLTAITITGTSGSFIRPATVTVVIPYFTIGESPATFSMPKGNLQNFTITITRVYGFSGTVSLSSGILPVGSSITSSLSSSSVSLSSGGSAQLVLTIRTTSSTPGGVYQAIINGTNGKLLVQSSLTFAVTPYSVSFIAYNTFTGIKVKTTGIFSVDSPSTTLTVSGVTSVLATNSSTGAFMAFKGYAIGGLPFSTTFIVDVPVFPHLASKVIISLGVSSFYSNVTVARNRDLNLDGLVDTPDLNIVAASFGCSFGSSCYNPAADINFDGTVNIVDLALVASAFGTTDYVPNFQVSGTTNAFVVGSSGTSTVTLASVNGGSGTAHVSLTAPAGVTASLNSSSVFLPVNGTATLKLTASSSVDGVYGVNVTATVGTITHWTIVRVLVQDFAITGPNHTVTLRTGFSTTVLLNVKSVNGFAGTVSLSLALDPGLTGTLNGTSVSLSANSTRGVLLTVKDTTANIYNATMTGTYGSITHSVTVQFAPPCPNPCPNIIETQNSLNSPSNGTQIAATTMESSKVRLRILSRSEN